MNIPAWERVQAARNPQRPTAQFYIDNMIDGFMELHGDRCFGDDPAIIGGIGLLGGLPVTVIAQEKGGSTQEKAKRSFGSPHPEGYRKALRLMQQAEKFNRPVLCLVDTQGAFCGIGAEERGQGSAIAQNLLGMMGLKTPIVSIIIGEGGSGGALALAVADRVAILENAFYSILSPEGFATILWKDASRAAEAAEVMKLTAQDLMELGVVDDILPEPQGGAQQDAAAMSQTLKDYVVAELQHQRQFSIEALLANRQAKFRAMGCCMG